MHNRQHFDTSAARLMDMATLCAYLNLGRHSAQKFARSAQAERRFGKRLLYDRVIIDRALDRLGE